MRKRHISLISLALAIMLYGVERYAAAPITAPERSPARGASEAASSPQLYPVTKVVDGDTIDILKDGAKVRVRLLGIDTPEVVDPRKPVQCFGREASSEAHKLLDGKSVKIETDPSQDTYDKYERLLAYVRLPNDTLVNEYLIAQGYAHEYTYDLPYKYQTEFKAAERTAREAQKGLWAPDTCNGDTQ